MTLARQIQKECSPLSTKMPDIRSFFGNKPAAKKDAKPEPAKKAAVEPKAVMPSPRKSPRKVGNKSEPAAVVAPSSKKAKKEPTIDLTDDVVPAATLGDPA